MTVRWLGQAGLLFQTEDLTVMVDPYLSNSVANINPCNERRFPVDESLFQIKPDVLIFTHNHLDHYDPETVERFICSDYPMTVLAPSSVWPEVRKYGGPHNYVQFNSGTEWTVPGARFRAVPAVHSDPHAIGVILEQGGKRYYVTGDTLYDRRVIDAAGPGIDVLFLPVNGVGNNMNMTDAVRFAQALQAKTVVPVHFGLFDSLDPADLDCPNKVIPQMYKEIEFPSSSAFSTKTGSGRYTKHKWQSDRHFNFGYVQYLPKDYDEEKKYPLVFFLHGAGERGDDLDLAVKHGYMKHVREEGREYPFILIAPQCPQDKYWGCYTESLLAFLDHICDKLPVDRDRICLTGLSMGGTGTWMLGMAAPERFACMVPVCGSGICWNVKNLLQMPIYMYHGDCDEGVPITESTTMLKAINKRGGNAQLKICYGVGHNVWNQAYSDEELLEWILAQKK